MYHNLKKIYIGTNSSGRFASQMGELFGGRFLFEEGHLLHDQRFMYMDNLCTSMCH